MTDQPAAVDLDLDLDHDAAADLLLTSARKCIAGAQFLEERIAETLDQVALWQAQAARCRADADAYQAAAAQIKKARLPT